MALYEPAASLVPQPGQIATGAEAVREALGGFLALKGTMAAQVRKVIPAGDITLTHAEWTITGDRT